jgi:peptidoglycan hydrolase CwlO-like protein
MGDQSRFERPPGPDRHSRSGRIFVLTLLAVALIVPLGVYETIPVNQHKATAPPPPDPTAQAIHDLQASLQHAVGQLGALQQTVSSDRAEVKRLSDDVTALSAKIEVLQQSFASQQAPAVQPTEPPRQKRATAR